MQQKCDTRLSTFNATPSATKGNNVSVPFIDGKIINYQLNEVNIQLNKVNA